MTSTEHIILMRKFIRGWYKGKTYDAENESSVSRKCTYEITNVRCEDSIWKPTVYLDVKIHSHHLYTSDNKWVKVGKPGGSRLRTINHCMRRLVLEDKRIELSMFDISKDKYQIKVGIVKWELKKK